MGVLAFLQSLWCFLTQLTPGAEPEGNLLSLGPHHFFVVSPRPRGLRADHFMLDARSALQKHVWWTFPELQCNRRTNYPGRAPCILNSGPGTGLLTASGEGM